MYLWDQPHSVGYLHPIAGIDELSELQEARVKVEAALVAQNDLLMSTTGDAQKAARKAYIELTKVRDLIYGKLKAMNRGVLPSATQAPPKSAALVPGDCYTGPIPKTHFERGVATGSEEPFTVRGHLIVRSPVCETGWMVHDPRARAASHPTPVVRRRVVVNGWIWD